MSIYLYTDGAAKGNPGNGGYGVVLKSGHHYKEMAGGFRLTTNNRMELLAVIIGLEEIKKDNTEKKRKLENRFKSKLKIY